MTGLVCPRCAEPHALDERFCRTCGMPLVYGPGAPAGPVADAQQRARKVRPEYSRGELVRAVTARHQVEAEFVQGLLLEEGIPSTLRRTRGFDVPDFLAAGPRDVLVPQSALEPAREVLLQAELVPADPLGRASAGPRPGRVLAGLLAAVGLVGLLAWLGTELLAV